MAKNNWSKSLRSVFGLPDTEKIEQDTAAESIPQWLDQLVLYLHRKIAAPQQAAYLSELKDKFVDYNVKQKLDALPKTYLLFEHYLTEVEATHTREKLRGLITERFDALKDQEEYALLFTDPERQEFYLSKKFLLHVLGQVQEVVGNTRGSIYNEARRWLYYLQYPEGLIEAPYFLAKEGKAETDWQSLLIKVSLLIYERLATALGDAYTQRLFDGGVKYVAATYGSMEAFPAILSLMPERVLDSEKLRTLNKHQVEKILLHKISTLEAVNQELEAKNRQLNYTEQALKEAQQRTERSHVQSSGILATVNEGIIVIDERSTIRLVNMQADRIFGYETNELLGKPIHVLMPDEYKEYHNRGMERYSKTRMTLILNRNVILEGKRKSGELFPLQLNFAETVIGTETFFTAAVKDITDQIEIERELSRSREELELLVEERTADLAKTQSELEITVGELERSNEELEQFAYVISHDLQEPLRMISSYVQLLERRYKEQLDKEAHLFIQYAVEGSHRMKRLIQSLLQYSRVNKRAAPYTKVDLAELTKQVLSNLERRIADNNATVIVGEMPVLVGIDFLLLQLLQNLIDNGIKFRGDNDPIIHVDAVSEPKYWRFSVADNGIGIAPQYKQQIFVIFQRLHTRQHYEGTGIGLAVCKKIVERHQGEIWIESDVGIGSTFFFTISKALTVSDEINPPYDESSNE